MRTLVAFGILCGALAVTVPNLIVWLGGRTPVTDDAARDIFTDHAGFDTWDSAQRARRVFEVSSAVVVTPRFHMARALYDARRAGLRATGYAADRRDYGRVMRRLQVREAAARVKTLGDALTGADPHFLGTEIPITGDGRASWGD